MRVVEAEQQRRDDDQCEGVDDGASGGGDATEGVMELQRGLSGPQFPHAQRVLLQTKRHRLLQQFLRCQSLEGST